ncbi:MAG: hypothetical protein P8078_13315, partial [bacterium]
MKKIYMVILDSDINTVTDSIVKEGHLQLVDPGDSDKWVGQLSRGSSQESSSGLIAKRTKIESLLEDLHIDMAEDKQNIEITEQDWDLLVKEIDDIDQEVEEYKLKLDEKLANINNLQDLKEKSLGIPFSDLGLQKADKYSYLNIQAGKVFTNMLDTLRGKLNSYVHIIHPVATHKDQTEIVVIFLQKDSMEVQEILDQVNFEPLAEGEKDTISPEVLDNIDKKLLQAREDYTVYKTKFIQIA